MRSTPLIAGVCPRSDVQAAPATTAARVSSGHDHGATGQLALGELAVDVRTLVEGEAMDLGVQVARLGEGEHLDELGPAAPVRRGQRRLVRQAEEAERERSTGDADARDVTERPARRRG